VWTTVAVLTAATSCSSDGDTDAGPADEREDAGFDVGGAVSGSGVDERAAALLATCAGDDSVEDPDRSQVAATAIGVDDAAVEGIGDPAVADLGDPRLDVVHTALDLIVDDAELVAARATITSRLREPTAEVRFDLVGLDVHAVLVDGREVDAERDGAKLVVPLGGERAVGDELEVVVCYQGAPVTIPTGALYGAPVGWSASSGGSFVLAEPEAARTWFPSNEHPSDKSTFTFSVTVDAELVALANGVLVAGPVACTAALVADEPTPADDLDGGGEPCGGPVPDGGGPAGDDAGTWRWEMRQPMAAYLATVVVGDFERFVHPRAGDVPVEVWLPSDAPRAASGAFEISSDVVAFLAGKLGPYPFESYANVVLPGRTGDAIMDAVAFEAQSTSIYAEDAIEESIVVHETAHQWFGDAVTVERWSRDLWWVEGFATYAEWLWAEEQDGFEAYAVRVAAAGDATADIPVALADLPEDGLFDNLAYVGGALVFAALRAEVGDTAFFEIVQEFVATHNGGNASTADLVEVASDVAGRDLEPFFDAWVAHPSRPAAPDL
jgi:aminopeptidase N